MLWRCFSFWLEIAFFLIDSFYNLVSSQIKVSKHPLALSNITGQSLIFKDFQSLRSASPPSIRKIKTNYFIVSLAFADLLVSVLVMPFGAIELVHQHWIYGETFCLVRTSLDVLLTTASILHLCCIALDRWGFLVSLVPICVLFLQSCGLFRLFFVSFQLKFPFSPFRFRRPYSIDHKCQKIQTYSE